MAPAVTKDDRSGPRGQKSGWRFFPLAVVLGLSFVAIINTYMVVSAMDTFPGEAGTENGYELSNVYNKIITAEQAQAALGWKVVLFGHEQHLMIRFSARDGAPVGDLKLTAIARRAVGPENPTKLTFEIDGPGRWVSSKPLDLGLWLVDVTAVSPQRRFIATRRVIIR